MQKFGYKDDETVAEFRRRVGSRKGPVHVEFESGNMYIAMAAALWFSVENYERMVASEMDDPSDIDGRLALHGIVHDMQDCLTELFRNMGMELLDVPLSCSSEDIAKLKKYVKESDPLKMIQSVLGDLKTKLTEIDKETVPEFVVFEVSEDGVKDVTEEMTSPEISEVQEPPKSDPMPEVAQNGQID